MTMIQRSAAPGSQIGRVTAFLYGLLAYTVFVVSFLYAVGFVEGLLVPKDIDTGADVSMTEALVVDLLGEHEALAGVPVTDDVLVYLARVLAELAAAPRSAERSDARRRALAALPRALATAVAVGGEEGITWLEAECEGARQPGVRGALAEAVIRVQTANPVYGQRARAALEGSAKPLRDPSRVRPGVSRGKSTRRSR